MECATHAEPGSSANPASSTIPFGARVALPSRQSAFSVAARVPSPPGLASLSPRRARAAPRRHERPHVFFARWRVLARRRAGPRTRRRADLQTKVTSVDLQRRGHSKLQRERDAEAQRCGDSDRQRRRDTGSHMHADTLCEAATAVQVCSAFFLLLTLYALFGMDICQACGGCFASNK